MVNVLPPATRFKRIALDLLFPQWCIGCGREGNYICERCRQSLTLISPPVCPRCGKPQHNDGLCPDCVNGDITIDGIRAPFVFDGVIRRAIHELKYRNLRALALPLADLLYEYLRDNAVPGEVLVPVPLHRKRFRERGYNQSALLARQLGKLTGLPVVEDGLVRHRHTLPQVRTAGVDERRENVINAFSCPEEGLMGKNIILVDDVTTSGATLNACAEVLKSSGITTVWGLVVAIEP
jgi:ComF family protein